MAKKTNWASTANEITTVPDSLTGASRQILDQDHWPENFQDISGYCNTGFKMAANSVQPLGEELNTPIIVQDDFDFGIHSSTGDRYVDINPWEAQNDKLNITQPVQWDPVNKWLLSSSNQLDIDDTEDIVEIGVDIDEMDDANFDIITEEKSLQQPQQQEYTLTGLISSDRDFLLSQSSDFKPEKLPLMNEINNEQSHLDLTSLCKPEPLYYNQSNMHQGLPPFTDTSTKAVNNNSSLVNMNYSSSNDNNISSCFVPNKQERQNRYVIEPSRGMSAFVDGSLKNRKDSVNNVKRLESIVKSEEPFIGESKKQLSCSTSNNISINNLTTTVSSNNESIVTAIVIDTGSIKTTSTGPDIIEVQSQYVNSKLNQVHSSSCSSKRINVRFNSGGFIVPNVIKPEPVDSTDIEVEIINKQTTDTVVQPSVENPNKLPEMFTKRNNLKLNIDLAAKLGTSGSITPIFTPTTSIANLCNSSSTPEVLRLLNNKDEFDLLSYISGDGSGDPILFPGSGKSSPLIDKKIVPLVIPIQQQSQNSKAVVVEKLDTIYKPLPIVKEEEEEDVIKREPFEEASCSNFDDTILSAPSNRTVARRTSSKRKRIIKRSEDMESDLSNLSDFMEEDDEKHDKTFSLTTPKRRKRTTSNTSRASTEYSRSSEGMLYHSRHRNVSRDTDSSDHESILSSGDRYRELRDRNNEASRRSRLNRKCREQEMKEQANHLEDENRRLKAKAQEMENLVKKLRTSVMQLVTGKKD